MAKEMDWSLLKGDAAVKVIVGPDDGDCWCLPKFLLISESTFFEAALSTAWQEAKSNTVKLPDDDPATFACFVQWLYSGDWNYGLYSHDECLIELGKCWILGDKLGCESFREKAMATLNEELRTDEPVTPQFADLAFTKTHEGSMLRRLVIINFIRESIQADLRDRSSDWPRRPKQADAFSAELAHLMPTMAYYIALWCSKGGKFSPRAGKEHEKSYAKVMQILLERSPTREDLHLLVDNNS